MRPTLFSAPFLSPTMTALRRSSSAPSNRVAPPVLSVMGGRGSGTVEERARDGPTCPLRDEGANEKEGEDDDDEDDDKEDADAAGRCR